MILSVTRCDVGDTPRATITISDMKDGEGEGLTWTVELRTDMQIGTYPSGKPKLGAYVVIVEPPARRADQNATKAKASLTPAAKIALDALADALNEVGAPPPATEHIPRCVARVVTAEQWRTYAYRRQISKGKPRAQQAAFSRAQDLLLANGRIGAWDDHIWIVPRIETDER